MSWKTGDSWTGVDKQMHFKAGAGVFLAFAFVASLAWGPVTGAAGGLLATVLAGVGKEIWDQHHPPHTPSLQDAVVTVAAGAAAAGAWLLGAAAMGVFR